MSSSSSPLTFQLTKWNGTVDSCDPKDLPDCKNYEQLYNLTDEQYDEVLQACEKYESKYKNWHTNVTVARARYNAAVANLTAESEPNQGDDYQTAYHKLAVKAASDITKSNNMISANAYGEGNTKIDMLTLLNRNKWSRRKWYHKLRLHEMSYGVTESNGITVVVGDYQNEPLYTSAVQDSVHYPNYEKAYQLYTDSKKANDQDVEKLVTALKAKSEDLSIVTNKEKVTAFGLDMRLHLPASYSAREIHKVARANGDDTVSSLAAQQDELVKQRSKHFENLSKILSLQMKLDKEVDVDRTGQHRRAHLR